MDTPSPNHGTARSGRDATGTAADWMAGDPAATAAVNALHLLLITVERHAGPVLGQALPLVTEEGVGRRAREAASPGSPHTVRAGRVLEHLAGAGLDTRAGVRQAERVLGALLSGRTPGGLPLTEREWLRLRLAVVAAAEHFAAVLGDWILHAGALDQASGDPELLDLLRRHGAGRVERRSVAFDVFQLTGGRPLPRYARRVEGMLLTAPVLLWLWLRGASQLLREGSCPPGARRYGPREHHRAVARGLLPAWRSLGSAVPRYLRRSYHPSQEGSLYVAAHYLAGRPARRASPGSGRPATS